MHKMGCLFPKTKDDFDLENSKTNGTQNPKLLTSSPASAAVQSCIAWRYYIATLGFISLFLINAQRMAMAVAMVKMVNFTSSVTISNNVSLSSCPITINATEIMSEPEAEGEFNWSPQLQGFILGGAFLGYSIGPISSGGLADKFGSKVMIFWGTIVYSGGLLLCPVFSWWDVNCLIVLQVVRGIAQGCVLPATFLLMANWAPPKEKGFISSFIMTGFFVGSMGGGLIAGVVCEFPLLGWQGVFYILGAAGILFSILFVLTFYNTPKDHPRISEAELKYITEDQAIASEKEKLPVPWLKVVTSVPFYALLIGVFAFYWIVFYFLSLHPTYVRNILHYSIMKSGFISSMPFILKIVGSLGGSAFSDWLYRRKYFSIDQLRRGFNFVGCLIFALSMLGLYLANCSEVLNILFMSISLLGAGIMAPGSLIAVVDMAPNFTGILSGVVTSFACLSGFIVPVVVGYMTKEQTMDGWKNVFLLNFGLVLGFSFVFLIFGSAEVQPWNSVEREPEKSQPNLSGKTVTVNADENEANFESSKM